MAEENTTTGRGPAPEGAGADAEQGQGLERTAGEVLAFLGADIPDFVRDAMIDALHDAAEIADSPAPTFDDAQESAGARARMLADLFARTRMLSLREHRRRTPTAPIKRQPLTAQAAAKLAEGIVYSCEFEEEVVARLVVLLDGIADACLDATLVEGLATAARDRAYSLTVDCDRACDAYVARRRAQWARALFEAR